MSRLVCFSCAATERDGAEFPSFDLLGDRKLAVLVIGSEDLCLDCMREAARERKRKAAATRIMEAK